MCCENNMKTDCSLQQIWTELSLQTQNQLQQVPRCYRLSLACGIVTPSQWSRRDFAECCQANCNRLMCCDLLVIISPAQITLNKLASLLTHHFPFHFPPSLLLFHNHRSPPVPIRGYHLQTLLGFLSPLFSSTPFSPLLIFLPPLSPLLLYHHYHTFNGPLSGTTRVSRY